MDNNAVTAAGKHTLSAPDVLATHRGFGEPLGWTIAQTCAHLRKIAKTLRDCGNVAAADATEASVARYEAGAVQS